MKLALAKPMTGLFRPGALFCLLLPAGCRTAQLDPLPIHDPASGPAIKETWISVLYGGESKVVYAGAGLKVLLNERP